MSSPAKKPRREGKSKEFYVKQAHKGARNFLEAGQKGFLVTCNFKERDAIRECYQLLNEYNKKYQEDTEDLQKPDEDVDDIASQLETQIVKTKLESKERAHKFQSIDTGVQNCIFIKSSVDDVLKLGTDIIRDLAETKIKKTKVTLRLLPIEIVCKAKMEDIVNAAGLLFDKHFLKVIYLFSFWF